MLDYNGGVHMLAYISRLYLTWRKILGCFQECWKKWKYIVKELGDILTKSSPYRLQSNVSHIKVSAVDQCSLWIERSSTLTEKILVLGIEFHISNFE